MRRECQIATANMDPQTVSLGCLASGVSNLVWGLSVDRPPVRPLLVATYALKTVSLAVLLGTHTVPEAYLFTVLQGIATGGLGTLTTTRTYGLVSLGPIAALAHGLTGLYLPQRAYKGIPRWVHDKLLRCLIHTLRWNTEGQRDHEHRRPQHGCHYPAWSQEKPICDNRFC